MLQHGTRTQKQEYFDGSRVMLDSQLVQIIAKPVSLFWVDIEQKEAGNLFCQWQKPHCFFYFPGLFYSKAFFVHRPALLRYSNPLKRDSYLLHFLKLSIWDTNVNKLFRKDTKASFILIILNVNSRNTSQILMLKRFSLITSAFADLTRKIPCRNSLCREDVNKTSIPVSTFTQNPLIPAACETGRWGSCFSK